MNSILQERYLKAQQKVLTRLQHQSGCQLNIITRRAVNLHICVVDQEAHSSTNPVSIVKHVNVR